MYCNKNSNFAQSGDLIQLSSNNHKSFLFQLEAGGVLETHRGIISHDDIIGSEWGTCVQSHTGKIFYLFQPCIDELIKTTKRNTQIIYPKDIGYILLKLNIFSGCEVIEAGSGSGALTQVLAIAVGESGSVTSYDVRKEMQNLAVKNLKRLNLNGERVIFKNQNIENGFSEKEVDAIFLDLPNPYDYIPHVVQSLKSGGYFGTLLPTTNQIVKLLHVLRRYKIMHVEVSEILIRHYQAISEKFRPKDRMVAHTGYLIFGRTTKQSKNQVSQCE